jgi:hypothetical protein
MDSKIINDINDIVCKYWKIHLNYVFSKDMTEEEKLNNKYHEVTGGFLRKDSEYSYKKSWINVWNKASDYEKKLIMTLPNFDAEIFEEITSIKIVDEIEIVVNGITKKISKNDAKKLGLI